MQDPDTMTATNAGLDAVSEDANNVLVVAPTHGGHWRAACRHFRGRHRHASSHLLVLTYVLGTSAYVSQFQATDGDPPAALAVIEASGERNRVAHDVDWPVEVRHEAPGDLTGIGIQCSEFLSRWHDAGDVAVCVESITSMLQYVPLQTAYRFLHVLTHRIGHADATAHYHVSPAAHTTQELGTIKQLFDAVATFDEDTETWSIAER